MYLMRKRKWSLEDAYEFVQGKRDVVEINEGFLEQLSKWAV